MIIDAQFGGKSLDEPELFERIDKYVYVYASGNVCTSPPTYCTYFSNSLFLVSHRECSVETKCSDELVPLLESSPVPSVEKKLTLQLSVHSFRCTERLLMSP